MTSWLYQDFLHSFSFRRGYTVALLDYTASGTGLVFETFLS